MGRVHDRPPMSKWGVRVWLGVRGQAPERSKRQHDLSREGDGKEFQDGQHDGGPRCREGRGKGVQPIIAFRFRDRDHCHDDDDHTDSEADPRSAEGDPSLGPGAAQAGRGSDGLDPQAGSSVRVTGRPHHEERRVEDRHHAEGKHCRGEQAEDDAMASGFHVGPLPNHRAASWRPWSPSSGGSAGGASPRPRPTRVPGRGPGRGRAARCRC